MNQVKMNLISQVCRGFRSPKILGIFIFVILGLVLLTTVPSVKADTINPGVFPINSKPYGLTYDDWTAKWWQWVLGIPKNSNPTTDTTGQYCSQSQSNPHVWFLAGTDSGSAQRTCVIPSGKAILLPVLNGECTYKDSAGSKTPADLRDCALKSDAGVSTLAATIDGVNMQNVDKYRVTSNLFNTTLANNNILGVTPGPTQGISDGWWFILHPLSVGNHTIHFIGVLGSPTVTPTLTSTNARFASEVTYHITVK
jgi:hypothetical protein